ncbi:MAG TPA: ATP-dependent Clp protease ATP-binding subunit, partial [Desulfobacteraceae bacterium]|nr:ATP-dependent Clp protease ATP-binding subunit [Desulfobacteraceae bacterium]
LKCIGATTIAEYRRYIEKDAALERRFEKIIINEPSRDEALEILKGIKPEYEKHHNIRISSKALEAAVDLSIRFDSDHRLPDKAIDLLATAASKTELPMLSMGPDAARRPKIQGQ